MMVPPKKAMLAIGATHAHLQIQDLHQQPHQGGCPDAIASMEESATRARRACSRLALADVSRPGHRGGVTMCADGAMAPAIIIERV